MKQAWAAATLVIIGSATVFLASYHTSSSEEGRLIVETLPQQAITASATIAISTRTSSTTPGALHIPILIYHSVRPHIEGQDAMNEAYDITPELLDQELTYLEKNGFTPITMNELTSAIKRGYSPALHPIALTFDDGWRNQYNYAFPLLAKHRMKATFYIYTNPIDHDMPHFLSWNMVREMDAAGMEIASHSTTHPLLYKLDPESVTAEMKISKARIESELGHVITDFASPFGLSNLTIQSAAQSLDYASVRDIAKGAWHTRSDLYALPGTLGTDSFTDFVRALNRD